MVPKIIGKTVEENRELRREQLISAALEIARSSGPTSVSVSAVAHKAGLSRASFYEYFSSSADLLTDLLIDELNSYTEVLLRETSKSDDPFEQIERWIRAALHYASDGRHMLAKSLATVTPPEFRREEVAIGHRQLLATILAPLERIGLDKSGPAMAFVRGTVDTASVRIDAGLDPEREIQQAVNYTLAGLRALVNAD